MATPLVRTATARDAQSIRVLLELAGSPTADLVSSQPEFIVACQDTRIIGAGALQRFGAAALLRSMVVEVGARGSGVGHLILQELERRSRAGRCSSSRKRHSHSSRGRTTAPSSVRVSRLPCWPAKSFGRCARNRPLAWQKPFVDKSRPDKTHG